MKQLELLVAGLVFLAAPINVAGAAEESKAKPQDAAANKEGEQKPPGLIATLRHGKRFVSFVAFSPDGKTIVITGAGEPLKERQVGHDRIYRSAIELWDAKSRVQLVARDFRVLRQVAFSPTGRFVAAASERMVLEKGVVEAHCVIDFFSVPQLEHQGTLSIHPYCVDALAISPEGKTIAGRHKSIVSVWDVASQKLLHRVRAEEGEAPREVDTYSGFAYSHDGKTLAASTGKGRVALYDTATWKVRTSFANRDGSPASIVFSPDDRILAAVVGHPMDPDIDTVSEFGGSLSVQLWDARLAKPLNPPGFERNTPKAWMRQEVYRGAEVAFSHDGKVLASLAQDVRLWDVATQKRLLEFSAGPKVWVSGVSFSPKEPILAVSIAEGTVQLWNLDTLLQRAATKQAEKK